MIRFFYDVFSMGALPLAIKNSGRGFRAGRDDVSDDQ